MHFVRTQRSWGWLAASSMLLSLGAGSWSHAAEKPQLIRSEFKPGELRDLCQKAVDKAQTRFDAIAKFPATERSYANTVLAFETTTADLSDDTTPLSFMKYVSPDKNTNKEGAECEQKVSVFSAKTFGRRDLYVALKDERPGNADEKRLLKMTLEAFEANGLKLPDDKLAKVTELFTKLNDLQTAFSDNLNNDDTKVEFTKEELNGVTGDFLSRLKKTDDGKRYIVTTKVTDYLQVMQYAKNEDTRKKMMIAYNNRQGEKNTKLLEDAIRVREQIASMLGFRTWADYQLSHNRMAKDAKTVLDFLNDVKDRIAEREHKDLAQLLAYKKSEDPKAKDVKAWDIEYLTYQIKKRDYSLDDEKIREYFPSDRVVQGMFKVYSKLLGVKFQPVKNAKVWAPDVKLYKIVDTKSGRPIGFFYTDFIPRQGKYEHFASFNIINGRMLNGKYDMPVSAIVGNFTPPANGKPSLLNHDEVETVFHEFGHIMHQTLTRAPYASLSGSNVAQDFVEAPSQMLENWVWQEKVLNQLSGKYNKPSEKLPEATLKKMIEVRDFEKGGYYYTRQAMLALTDMTYHTATGPVDTAAVYDQLYKDVIGIEPIHGGHFAASFGHLMGGYDAGYYGYLWSEVYAQDMFSAFENTDVLDPRTGARYRKTILERGNMEDAGDLLTAFLGRPTNNEAFLKKLHIGGDDETMRHKKVMRTGK